MKEKTLQKFIPETVEECDNLECEKCYYFTPDYCEGQFCYAKRGLSQEKGGEENRVSDEDTADPVEMKLEIEILSLLDGHHKEELEDKIKEFLKEYGVRARINSSTGNELTVSPGIK